MKVCWYARRFALCVAAVALLGCQAKTVSKADKSPHLATLARLYHEAESTLGHRPKDEAEFKSFIASRAHSDSSLTGNIEELFLSERDGQPFAVLYGDAASAMQSSLVAYEQIGVEGKRLAASSLGVISQVSAKKFVKLVSPGAAVQK
jgi:hypothetical protein